MDHRCHTSHHHCFFFIDILPSLEEEEAVLHRCRADCQCCYSCWRARSARDVAVHVVVENGDVFVASSVCQLISSWSVLLCRHLYWCHLWYSRTDEYVRDDRRPPQQSSLKWTIGMESMHRRRRLWREDDDDQCDCRVLFAFWHQMNNTDASDEDDENAPLLRMTKRCIVSLQWMYSILFVVYPSSSSSSSSVAIINHVPAEDPKTNQFIRTSTMRDAMRGRWMVVGDEKSMTQQACHIPSRVG